MMAGKLVGQLLAGVVVLASALVFAAPVEGTITKVDEGGSAITVKAKDGKETAVKISGKRTELEGVKDRSDLKVGQTVSVTEEGGEAKKISTK
ncbi:MAG: PTS glucose transporter subunit IIA [Burkholderiales bacterium]|nr:PTS glucose transporter subunit IIA [Burkholderiales bacterium]